MIKNNHLSVLIVDDTPKNIQVVAGILQKEGYSLFFAANGMKALELAEKNSFDLVLMDAMMPGMDGFEVCKHLKQKRTYADVPVIFLTAKTERESILQGFEAGGVDYVTKPFSQRELLFRVKAHLQIRSLTRELHDTNRALENRMDIVDRFVMMLTIDGRGYVTYASNAFCRAAGRRQEEVMGADLEMLCRESASTLFKDIREIIHNNRYYSGELKATTTDGKDFWFGVNIFYFSEEISAAEYKIIMEDITDRKVVEKLSITDDLTGLYNRRYFNKVFPDEISRARRDGKILVFALIDVDYFKLYNDAYGHPKGDEILVTLAQAMKNTMKRAGDHCFRLGGEEFGIIYTAKTLDSALVPAEMLCCSVEDLRIEHGKSPVSPYVTVSSGVCLLDFTGNPTMEITPGACYQKADEALYAAKHAGRNRAVCA